MKKFTSLFKFPCNFNTNTTQAESWRNATPELNPEYFSLAHVAVLDNCVYCKAPKHTTGVLTQRAAGGKWEKVSEFVVRGVSRRGTIEEYLERINAKPASFAGGPRL